MPTMPKSVTEKLDAVKELTENGVEFWMARQLMAVLGYDNWENFEKTAIGRAVDAFIAAEEEPSDHFLETKVMVGLGSGAQRGVRDYFLSRPACYLIAMNGDPRKAEIAEAQRYFAIQTRNMEKLQRVLADQRRLDARGRVRDGNKSLNSTAKNAGVKQFGLFNGAGIRGLYQMSLDNLRIKKGIAKSEDWLDRIGTEELAMNEFRITQTEAKLKREGVHTEEGAVTAHGTVGREIRAAVKRMGNAMPENIPAEPPIKEIEKRLSHSRRKPPEKLDGPSDPSPNDGPQPS